MLNIIRVILTIINLSNGLFSFLSSIWISSFVLDILKAYKKYKINNNIVVNILRFNKIKIYSTKRIIISYIKLFLVLDNKNLFKKINYILLKQIY